MFTGKVLYISKQKFPEVPPELWEAKAVENLTIVGINMAQIPSEIQNLKTLTKLCVSENNLTAIPKDLCALTNLASFDCTMNEVEFVATSSFPPSLTSLTFHNSKLKVLDCDSPLPNLTSLMLVGDNLPAVAPSGISSFHALRALNLSYNPGLEEPPASFSGLTSLETVKIVGCSLKMFPACFYKLKRLNTLHLTSNRIEGFESASDGSSLENMTALKTLDLSENLIKSVPDSLFEMRLSVLLIQSNKLSEIPSFGRICETLNVLDLSENYIKKLPKSFYNLREIRTINLSINDIEMIKIGKIEKNFTSLEKIHIFGNLLTIDPSVALPPTFNIKETDCPAEISEGVYLGSYRSACNRNGLKAKGITHILSVANLRPHFPDLFTYKIIDVEDVESAMLKPYFEECIKYISAALKAKGHVLVHCSAGVSRSASVCIAYLMNKKHMTCDAALQHIKSLRPVVSPNSGFIEQLKAYEKSSYKPCSIQ